MSDEQPVTTDREYLETAIPLLRLLIKEPRNVPAHVVPCADAGGNPCCVCKAQRFIDYYDGTINDLYAEDSAERP